MQKAPTTEQQPSERDCYTVNTVNICRAEQCCRPVTPALGRKNRVQNELETHLDYMLSSQGGLDYKQNFLCFKKKNHSTQEIDGRKKSQAQSQPWLLSLLSYRNQDHLKCPTRVRKRHDMQTNPLRSLLEEGVAHRPEKRVRRERGKRWCVQLFKTP